MHKNPAGACLIIATKICSTKQIPKFVSNAFKLIYFQTEIFYKNAQFASTYNKLCVLQNADSVIQYLNNTSKKSL